MENMPNVNGIETYSALTGLEGARLAKAIQSNLIDETGAKDRGAKKNALVVLSQNVGPACLVEVGFMSNKAEFDKITNDDYQDQIAQGIVNGICDYLDLLGLEY